MEQSNHHLKEQKLSGGYFDKDKDKENNPRKKTNKFVYEKYDGDVYFFRTMVMIMIMMKMTIMMIIMMMMMMMMVMRI